MATVDSHQHFWTRSRGDYTWLTEDLGPIYRDFGAEDLRPLIKAAGVDKTIIVQAAETVAETRYMLEIAEKTDFVVGVVGWVNFEAPDASTLIAELVQHPKLVGFRPMIQDLPDDDWMLRSDLEQAFRAIIDHCLAFDALVFPRHLKNLLALLQRYPELKTVIDHGAKPQIRADEYEPWASDMAEIAERTSAYCKISGLITEDGPEWSEDRLRPYVENLVRSFGPDRLIWGSDWPVQNLVGDYNDWIMAARNLFRDLTDINKNAIFGDNATQFYGLGC